MLRAYRFKYYQAGSLVLVEADDVGVLAETPSADVHVVFADEALSGSAYSAGSAVFAVLAGVGAPEEVRHTCGKYNIEYYYIKYTPFINIKKHRQTSTVSAPTRSSAPSPQT